MFTAGGFHAHAQQPQEMNTDATAPLPYRAIPDYAETFTPGTVVARFLDGLGYRYYWATEGLSETDLAYRPSEDARSTDETLDHLYGLSQTILNAAMKKPNVRPQPQETLSFEEKRRKTLENIQAASNLFRASSPEEASSFKIVFQRGDNSFELPFWNLMNGHITDAIYHVGQVVSFRRSSGNPMNPNVNVLMGKTRE